MSNAFLTDSNKFSTFSALIHIILQEQRDILLQEQRLTRCFFFFPTFPAFRKGIGCDHARARDYYIESINSKCRFKAFPCGNTEDFEMGRCPCNGKCARMGYASVEGRARGSYYLTTKDVSPFCKE